MPPRKYFLSRSSRSAEFTSCMTTIRKQSDEFRRFWQQRIVLQRDTGHFRRARRAHEVQDLEGRGGVIQALRADVRNTIALGIGASRKRAPGQIRAEAVR